jgi:hypothetical protein
VVESIRESAGEVVSYPQADDIDLIFLETWVSIERRRHIRSAKEEKVVERHEGRGEVDPDSAR